jgi:hypothetical protein
MADATLAALTRSELTIVNRELMLAGHLHDRASFPAILRSHAMDEANEIAIEEWMTASPVYTRRMQRLLDFADGDVGTIFKGFQLDIGMPHQFLDAGFEVHDADHGEFWLRSCGALADVRPMGHEMVRGMCVDIEDPTFDATAEATSPHAQVRPIHRPPEVPHGGPDCHWTITIDPAHPPIHPHPRLAEVESTLLAQLPATLPPSGEPGGWDDYARPFDPHFEFEDLSHGALQAVARELAIQFHLLARACMLAVDRRYGTDEAVAVGRATFTGVGWVAAERMAAALGIGTDDGDDTKAAGPSAIARVLSMLNLLTPADYLGITLESDDDALRVTLDPDAPALREGDAFSVSGLLDLGADEILRAIVHGVNPCATVEETADGAPRAWVITTPEGAPPAEEPDAVRLVRFSTGATAVFVRRRPIRR